MPANFAPSSGTSKVKRKAASVGGSQSSSIARQAFSNRPGDTKVDDPYSQTINQDDEWNVYPEDTSGNIRDGEGNLVWDGEAGRGSWQPGSNWANRWQATGDHPTYQGVRDFNGRPAAPGYAVYQKDYTPERMWQYRKQAGERLQNLLPENGRVVANLSDEDAMYMKYLDDLNNVRKYDAFVHTLYNWKEPGGLEKLKKLAPGYYERRVKAIEQDLKVKQRDAIVEFTGIQTPDDLSWVVRRKTGNIKTLDEINAELQLENDQKKRYNYGRWYSFFANSISKRQTELPGGYQWRAETLQPQRAGNVIGDATAENGINRYSNNRIGL